VVKTVRQVVTLDAPPEALFDAYLNSRRHAAVIGSKASISRRRGARFSVFDGEITGRNLIVVPERVIVQTWRASQWRKADPDSVLILVFSKAGRGGRIELLHLGIPAYDYAGVSTGWRQFYWRPWRALLRRTRRR
jgi:activator of HSP90 ATPase